MNTVQEIRNEWKTITVSSSVQTIRECMHIVLTMTELSRMEKAKVGNLLRIGNACVIFLDVDHEIGVN